jgi:hypothetical protein
MRRLHFRCSRGKTAISADQWRKTAAAELQTSRKFNGLRDNSAATPNSGIFRPNSGKKSAVQGIISGSLENRLKPELTPDIAGDIRRA